MVVLAKGFFFLCFCSVLWRMKKATTKVYRRSYDTVDEDMHNSATPHWSWIWMWILMLIFCHAIVALILPRGCKDFFLRCFREGQCKPHNSGPTESRNLNLN